MKTIHTSNLYLSSDTGVKGTGSDFEVYLPAHGFTVKDGQFMRITVQSILGLVRFTNVNKYNRQFLVQKYHGDTAVDSTTGASVAGQKKGDPIPCTIANENHSDIKTLANAFTVAMMAQMPHIKGATSDNTKEKQDGNGQIDVTLLTDVDEKFFIYFNQNTASDLSDAYKLLGGKVNTVPPDTWNMSGGMFVTPTVVTLQNGNIEYRNQIKSHYPAHTKTLTHIYVRSSMVTDSHQNHHFDSAKYLNDGHITGSQILCKAPIFDDYFQFDDMNSNNTGYTVNLMSRSLTYMRLQLTTDKDQPIPNPEAHTVEMVLRVDIMEKDD